MKAVVLAVALSLFCITVGTIAGGILGLLAFFHRPPWIVVSWSQLGMAINACTIVGAGIGATMGVLGSIWSVRALSRAQ
jgi:hypothetical protein